MGRWSAPNIRATSLAPFNLANREADYRLAWAFFETMGTAPAAGADLAALLDSPVFATAPPGDPAEMERIIAANRNAWED